MPTAIHSVPDAARIYMQLAFESLAAMPASISASAAACVCGVAALRSWGHNECHIGAIPVGVLFFSGRSLQVTADNEHHAEFPAAHQLRYVGNTEYITYTRIIRVEPPGVGRCCCGTASCQGKK